eukprot:GHVU01101321.1.p2 GENE.GHVU01101321.1~~GHVU01101321.1.p2  ORF type:complete len:104 (+),score=14.88 GHVU01101321.1:227-538(+)
METLATLSSPHVAGGFSGSFGRVDQLRLTGSLGGTTTAGDATASIVEDSTEIALGIPNVRVGDTDIGSDIGTDAVEGWNRGNRTDGDDEDAEQSGELHLVERK